MNRSYNKHKKWFVYSLSIIFLLIGFFAIYINSCIGGFQFNVYKAGLVDDEVIGNVNIKMSRNWYPMWLINDSESDTSSYPSTSYAYYDGCGDNEFISFYQLPEDYFDNNDLELTPFEIKEFPWGSAVLKEIKKPGRQNSNSTLAYIRELFIVIEVQDVAYLGEIESLEKSGTDHGIL